MILSGYSNEQANLAPVGARQRFAAGLRARERPRMRVWSAGKSPKFRWHIVYPTATLIT